MRNKITRRKFMTIGSSAFLGAGLSINTRCARGAHQQGSELIEVKHSGAVLEDRKIDSAAVRSMLRQGMEALSGQKQLWSRYFSKSDRVGLKINTLGRPLLFTHHELIDSVIAELTDFGIKANNIIVWDRWEHHMLASGFILNESAEGVRYLGAQNPRTSSEPRWDPETTYSSDFDTPDDRGNTGTASMYTSIFTKECDKIINMPILKDHSNSGITFCLKNIAYGITDNNSRFHRPAYISTFISDMCAQSLVRGKVVLHIGDALEGCFDRGPDPDSPRVLFTPKTLWLGTDPTAMDAVARSVIDDERMARGLRRVAETPGYYEGMRPADHIEMASEKGLGECSLDRIQTKKIQLS